MGNTKSLACVKYKFHYVSGDLDTIFLDALSERLDELTSSGALQVNVWFWEKKYGSKRISIYEMRTNKPLDEFKTFFISSDSKSLYINAKIL
jgi:hypothetical protein